MNHRHGSFRIWATVIVLALLIVVAAASLLPLLETNAWWIRYLDYPRTQFAVVTLVLMAAYLVLRGRPGLIGSLAVFGAVAALGYQVYKLHPYTELATPAVVEQTSCTQEQGLRVMIANVQRSNESADAFLDLVAESDPDILLVMETDAWWDEQLSVLDDAFRHSVQSIPNDHAVYGMHLFSKLALVSPEFQFFFDADTPSVVTELRLPGGETLGFIGLHPRPPLAWAQSTDMRDAHLLQAALMARESNAPTILAGDFNTVPWERVTRRAMRIGRLLDPRVGRGLYATYDTKSYLMSWPLDQILFQPQFALESFGTLPDFGSDHRAVIAALCHDPAAAPDAPELAADDLAEAQTSIDAARRD